MEKRSRGEFDLAALGCLAISAQDETHGFHVKFQDALLLFLRIAAFLFLQLLQFRIEAAEAVATPGEIEPDLQIENLLRTKIADTAPDIAPVKGETPLVEQFPIAGMRSHEVIPIRL